MKRFFAAMLCVVLVFLMIPTFASAAYSTTSTTGEDIQYPAERDFFATPVEATVMYFDGGTGIYYMPMPEPGHGTLGSIASGKKVLLLAEKNGFFFFSTRSGRCGWNGANWFDYDEKDIKGKRGGSSEPLESLTFSNTGAPLVFPKDKYYFDEPLTKTVKAVDSCSRIYLMPMPVAGFGDLGMVDAGEEVKVLAEKNGFYFFETADGRQGWNGKGCFE